MVNGPEMKITIRGIDSASVKNNGLDVKLEEGPVGKIRVGSGWILHPDWEPVKRNELSGFTKNTLTQEMLRETGIRGDVVAAFKGKVGNTETMSKHDAFIIVWKDRENNTNISFIVEYKKKVEGFGPEFEYSWRYATTRCYSVETDATEKKMDGNLDVYYTPPAKYQGGAWLFPVGKFGI